MKQNLVVINTLEQLDALDQFLDDFDIVAYDTETTGLDQDAEIIGYSLACDEQNGFYVVLAEWSAKDAKLIRAYAQFREKAIDILKKLTTKKLIMHNAIFDVQKTLANFGIDLLPALHTDTMILAHLLNENERVGLKDLGASLFGEDATLEQKELRESIEANGGTCTKKAYELYKASTDKIGKYAAKDAVLTMNLFYYLLPKLYEEKLDKFFYEDECMPLLKGPTYELNDAGLKIDVEKLTALKFELEQSIVKLHGEILEEITPYIADKYPGTNEKNSFNIGSNEQLAWLVFVRLGQTFNTLTKGGREKAKEWIGRVPYTKTHKYLFMKECERRGVRPEKYMQCDKSTLELFKIKYPFIDKLLKMKKEEKILSTYVCGILDRVRYGVIRPSFLQTGTTGTRYSSRDPNFQNLPRDDKRVKACVVSRPGKVFIGADYSQLEPRVFTAVSQDPVLLEAYAKGEDFYSAIAIPVFNKEECSADKNADNYLGKMFPEIRQLGKVAALSIAYGTGAFKLAQAVKLPVEICQEIIEDYYKRLTGVAQMVQESHAQAIKDGYVKNLFGRPRRIPKARLISKFNKKIEDLGYEYRTLLNLAVNFRIQGTAGSLINRVAIQFHKKVKELGLSAKLVMQVHDELIVECAENEADAVAGLLKDCMENTVQLPGVSLIAEPKIAKNLGELK
jgi:DNA polymerase-1